MTELTITPTLRDDVLVLEIAGEIDVSCVDVLESALAEQQRGLPVVVDLSLLAFIDSSGLHALFKAAEAGWLAALVRAKDSTVSRVLDIVQVNKLVRVFDDLPAAVSHVKKSAA